MGKESLGAQQATPALWVTLWDPCSGLMPEGFQGHLRDLTTGNLNDGEQNSEKDESRNPKPENYIIFLSYKKEKQNYKYKIRYKDECLG